MDNITSIPNFSGEPGAVACTEFFDKIEFYAEYFKWDEESKKFVLLSRLSGDALRCVKHHKQKDFKALEGLLKDKYIQKDTPDVALGKFTNFKQPSGMSVQMYFDKMSELSHRALVIDGVDPAVAEQSRKAMLHCILLNNLAPELRRGVLVKNPKSVQETLEFALLEEKALKSINPFYPMQNEFPHFTTNPQPHMACAATFSPKEKQDEQIRELTEKLNLLTAKLDSIVDKRESDQARTERGNSRDFLCFWCGKAGHYASECRLRNQQYFNNNSNSRGNYQGRSRGGNFRGNNYRQRGNSNFRGDRNFSRENNRDEQEGRWERSQGNRQDDSANRQTNRGNLN